jgi:CHAT domain
LDARTKTSRIVLAFEPPRVTLVVDDEKADEGLVEVGAALDDLDGDRLRLERLRGAIDHAADRETLRQLCERHADAQADLGGAMAEALLPRSLRASLEQLLNASEVDVGRVEFGISTGSRQSREGRDLVGMPWEALEIGSSGTPLALRPTVDVYRVSGGIPRTSRRPPGPLRILAAVAQPLEDESVDELDGDIEVGYLQQVLEEADSGVQMVAAAAKVEGLEAILGSGRFDVLHLSAHGMPGFLRLEKWDGQGVDLPGSELKKMMKGAFTEFVVLSSCFSAQDGHGLRGAIQRGSVAMNSLQPAAISSVAAEVSDSGAPAVLAMGEAVSSGFALALCARVYRDLATGKSSVLRAVSDARRSLAAGLDDEGGHWTRLLEWATPILYLSRDPSFPPGETPSHGADDPRLVDIARELGALVRSPYVARPGIDQQIWNFIQGESDAVLLCYGPPGTGKTAAVARALLRTPVRGVAVMTGSQDADAVLASFADAVLIGRPNDEDAINVADTLRDRRLGCGERVDALSSYAATSGHLPTAVLWDRFDPMLDLRPPGKQSDPLIYEVGDEGVVELLERLRDAHAPKLKLLITARSHFRLRGHSGPALPAFNVGAMTEGQSRRLLELWLPVEARPDGLCGYFMREIGGNPGAAVELGEALRSDSGGVSPAELAELIGEIRRGIATVASLETIWGALDPHSRAAAARAAVFRRPVPRQTIYGQSTPSGRRLEAADPEQFARLKILTNHPARDVDLDVVDWDAAELSEELLRHLGEDIEQFPWLALTWTGVFSRFDGLMALGLLGVHATLYADPDEYNVLVPRWAAPYFESWGQEEAREGHLRALEYWLSSP